MDCKRQGDVLSMISHRLQFINVEKHCWDGSSLKITMTVLINDEKDVPVRFDDVRIYNEREQFPWVNNTTLSNFAARFWPTQVLSRCMETKNLRPIRIGNYGEHSPIGNHFVFKSFVTNLWGLYSLETLKSKRKHCRLGKRDTHEPLFFPFLMLQLILSCCLCGKNFFERYQLSLFHPTQLFHQFFTQF